MKIAYAVVGPDWVVHVFCEAFAPGDQVEIRPRVAPGEEWRSPRMNYYLDSLLGVAATHADFSARLADDLRAAVAHLQLAAAPEGQEVARGVPLCSDCDDPQPCAAHPTAGPEVPSALPREGFVFCENTPLGLTPHERNPCCIRPRPALPEEVVCDKWPLTAHPRSVHCYDPRPAHPPSSVLGEKGDKTGTGFDRISSCDSCGATARRPFFRHAPRGWLWLKAFSSEMAADDYLIMAVCSERCARAIWHDGPGPRLDAPAEPVSAAPVAKMDLELCEDCGGREATQIDQERSKNDPRNASDLCWQMFDGPHARSATPATPAEPEKLGEWDK